MQSILIQILQCNYNQDFDTDDIKELPVIFYMKAKQQKPDSKYTSLIVKTSAETAFDARWCQLKIDGKNIPSRSNHIAAFFNNRLYIHGGYDADKGVMSDFNSIDVSDDCDVFQWKKLNNTVNGEPLRLKNHTAVTYKNNLIAFGGELHNNQSSNVCYAFDFVDGNWKKIKAVNSQKIPKVDSHSACLIESKMYIYGGFVPDKAQYMKNIYCLDLEKMQWSTVYESTNKQEPEGRSNLAMVTEGQSLWIFGGTNGQSTLADLWKFDLTQKVWTKIDQKNSPEARRGHSMVVYKGYIFLFGGIQDITKQKNDIYAFQISSNTWSKIHTSTNSVYDCSPTLKQQRKKSPSKSPDKIILHKVESQKNPDRSNQDVMKKILTENKHKKFLEKKKELLRQFSEKPGEYNKNRSLSPTTQSMLKTLQSIGNQQVAKKELKQEIMYDESHRFIIGKKPCARDGQSVVVHKQKMYIFGGDRHLMAFNDLYSFDLEKGVTSIDLYRAS